MLNDGRLNMFMGEWKPSIRESLVHVNKQEFNNSLDSMSLWKL